MELDETQKKNIIRGLRAVIRTQTVRINKARKKLAALESERQANIDLIASMGEVVEIETPSASPTVDSSPLPAPSKKSTYVDPHSRSDPEPVSDEEAGRFT